MTEKTQNTHYDEKYANGGFRYNIKREVDFIQARIIEPFGLGAHSSVLELGCGNGLHSALIASHGPEVFGLDASSVGIQVAKDRQSQAQFICDTADNLSLYFEPDYFDLIFVRGMSWYHYELNQMSEKTGIDIREKTADFFEYLKPGGRFILQIATDFSGTYPPDKVIKYNTLTDYINLFEPLGEIVHVSNWRGTGLTSQAQAELVGGNVFIVTKKRGE